MAEVNENNPIIKLHKFFQDKAYTLGYQKPDSDEYHKAKHGIAVTEAMDPAKWEIKTPPLSSAEIIAGQRITAIQTIDKNYEKLEKEGRNEAVGGILEHINDQNFGAIKNKNFAADVIAKKGEEWHGKIKT